MALLVASAGPVVTVMPALRRDEAIAPAPVVTVVIPVKNAVRIIGDVLRAIAIQQTPWPFEVLVIDSGSQDGTLEVLEQARDRVGNLRVVRIPPEQYGHGRTRNLGAQIANTPFVAYLTHDAIPDDAHWLANLVRPMQEDNRIAGVFGRHIAHLDASACARRDLRQHFDGLRAAGRVLWLENADRYQNDIGYRQLLHFYSDNNSCLRRSVWERIPYPDVDFAEDQLWAKQIIESGYRKAYADDAVVRHSHDYGVVETFKRSFDESGAFKAYFGYVLAGTPRLALSNGLHCARRDFAFVRGPGGGGIAAATKAALDQLAKQLGYLLGARADRFPGWFLRIVSLDRRLKYGPLSVSGMLGKFWRSLTQEGPRTALARTFGAAARSVDPRPADHAVQKIDVPHFFEALYDPSDARFAQQSLLRVDRGSDVRVDMLWFIPDFGSGSGGHLNLFRFFRGLELLGLRGAVVIVGTNVHENQGMAKAKIEQYFGAIDGDIYFASDVLPSARTVFATSWLTAYYVNHYACPGARKYYFVQDYEPMFYAAGFDAHAAGRTYELGLRAICAGPWLQSTLSSLHGASVLGHLGFSYDHEIYQPAGKRDDVKRVFFYVRPPTARRGFELGMLALDIVGTLRPDVHFIFAGWDISAYNFDHVHLNAGVLASAQLPDLYSQCDVALVLSFTNMSLLPYEVMACECAVVTNNSPCATWGLSQDVATYASPTPEDIAAKIVALLDDDEGRRRQVKRARTFVEQTSWKNEIARLHTMLVEDPPAT